MAKKVVVGVSTGALFDMTAEKDILAKKGKEEYIKYQIDHENEPLKKGKSYSIVESLLKLNDKLAEPIIEVVVMSKSDPDVGMRVFNTIDTNKLAIDRAAFTNGEKINKYLNAFKVDMLITGNSEDKKSALEEKLPVVKMMELDASKEDGTLRLAFDADIEKMIGNAKFEEFLKVVAQIKQKDNNLIKVALLADRTQPSYKLVLTLLRENKIKIDETFFIRGTEKDSVLEIVNPNFVFDIPSDNKVDTKSNEAKPAEVKPQDTKPVEAKPAEVKPAEVKPAEVKPPVKPVEPQKPVEQKPASVIQNGKDFFAREFTDATPSTETYNKPTTPSATDSIYKKILADK